MVPLRCWLGRPAGLARLGVGLLVLAVLMGCGQAGQRTTATTPLAAASAPASATTATPSAAAQAAPSAVAPSGSATSDGGTPTMETSTSTPPSADPDAIAPLLQQPGDLPDTIMGQPADDPMPTNFENQPPARAVVGRGFVRGSRSAGRVSVLLYESASDLAQAYKRLTAGLRVGAAVDTPQLLGDVGERAVVTRVALASSTYGTDHVSIVIFTRCRALFDVRLFEQADVTAEVAIAYARRLDQRLAPLLCG